MDTTKDVYDDSDVPEYQIYAVNGDEKQIPWNEVPEARRWLTIYEVNRPGSQVIHVPVVKYHIWAQDKDGNPVDPYGDQVWTGNYTEYGLNPKHMRAGRLGKAH